MERSTGQTFTELTHLLIIIFCKNEQIFWPLSEQEFSEQILQVSIFWGWKEPKDEKSAVSLH